MNIYDDFIPIEDKYYHIRVEFDESEYKTFVDGIKVKDVSFKT